MYQQVLSISINQDKVAQHRINYAATTGLPTVLLVLIGRVGLP